LLLFENPDNLEVKTEFDHVMAEVINPFSSVRLWLLYEVLEIEAMQETFDMRRKILGKYRSAVL